MSKNTKSTNKQLTEAHQTIQNLSKLLKVAEIIVSATNIDNLLEVIMRMAEEIMNAETSSLTLIDEKTGDLQFVVVRGEAGKTIKSKSIKLGQGICGWAAKTGECLIINDPYNDPRFDSSFDKTSGFKTRSYLCMPLKTFDGSIIGTVQVLNKRKGKFTKKDSEIFAHFCNLSAIAIRNQKLINSRNEQQQIQADLDYARSIQQNFLPKKIPHTKDYHFDSFYLSAKAVGGDFYDIVPLKNNKMAVYIADVSGKGIPAALFMSKMSSNLRFLLENEKNQLTVMEKINNQILERSSRGMFITLLLLVIELKTGKIKVFNAGHISPFIIGIENVNVFKRSENPPVGIINGIDFKTQEFTIKPAERIVLITDGLTDIKNEKNKILGIDGLKNIIEKHRASDDFKGDFLKEIDKHLKATGQPDDITMISILRSPLPDYRFEQEEIITFTDADHTKKIKDIISKMAGKIGFNTKDINLIIVAVLEALSNVVKYTYEQEVGKIKVSVLGEGKVLKIFLRDYGKKVDEEKIVSRNLEDIRPGGLGIHFMKEIMDSVEYLPVKDGNELRLIKKVIS
ncbi:SpoIIE family protein phosphatase [bacterium]|nr:SpoIIE family protein phosphatase [bacterium]